MSQKSFILCPGQGAQHVGMGKDFHEKFPAARKVFEQANQIVGYDLAALCFNGPDDRLNQTDIAQPAIYVAGVASFRAAVETGFLDPSSVAGTAGLSLGEYTALHLAGVFSFEDGLRLVSLRGRAMQEAAVASPSGMVAIMGGDEPSVTKLCADAAENDVLVPANFNAPGQIVISGSQSACDRALKLSESANLRAVALKVAGAFHSPLMQPAADKLKTELNKTPFSPPAIPVYSNVTAAVHTDPASIKQLLVAQLTQPVRWEQSMVKALASEGIRFIELAPGRTLAGLAKRISRRTPIESLATAESLTPAS